MHKSLSDVANDLRSVSKIVHTTSDSIAGFRQLSHATVVSVAADYGTCDVILRKNGVGIKGVIISMTPNSMNIMGYPCIGDTVLIYHQGDNLDAHVMMKIHDNSKSFYEYDTYKNNCSIPASALAG